jgi:hypothetical protein
MVDKKDNWDERDQQIVQELAGPVGVIAIGIGCFLLGNSYNIFTLLAQIYEYIVINGILLTGLTVLELILIYGGLLGIGIGIAWLASIVIRDSH